jgi:hypothetical protein
MDDAFFMLTLWFLLVAPLATKSLFNVPGLHCYRW